jgi:integrase
MANAFLNAKKEAVDAGELPLRTWMDDRSVMVKVVDGLGTQRGVTTLEPQDFATLKNKLAKRNGPHRMCTVIQVIRCAFKHAYESGLLDRPLRFGPAFKRTSQKTRRLHKAKQGAKLFTPKEILALLLTAPLQLEAMILLGINCGFGNADCGTLPLSAVDLKRGIIDCPRPKTGIDRRCVLWPETIEALKQVLAVRREPNAAADAGLVFITRYGKSRSKAENSAPPLRRCGSCSRSSASTGTGISTRCVTPSGLPLTRRRTSRLATTSWATGAPAGARPVWLGGGRNPGGIRVDTGLCFPFSPWEKDREVGPGLVVRCLLAHSQA